MKCLNILAISALILCVSCNTPGKQLLEKQLSEKQEQIEQLEEQLDHLQMTNSSLLDRMADLSVINRNDAESIRNSIVSINKQFDLINELSDEVERKDSLNNILASNLKKSFIEFDDEDIEVSVQGSQVLVSLSDRLMFHTASSRINGKALKVLEKIAFILNDNNDINVLVEGHTDNIPIDNKNYQDNWDLSVGRATAVVRLLQDQFGVDPLKMTAAGKGEFMPKADNESEFGRRLNRRTEIKITPKLDQFFKLLKSPELLS